MYRMGPFHVLKVSVKTRLRSRLMLSGLSGKPYRSGADVTADYLEIRQLAGPGTP